MFDVWIIWMTDMQAPFYNDSIKTHEWKMNRATMKFCLACHDYAFCPKLTHNSWKLQNQLETSR